MPPRSPPAKLPAPPPVPREARAPHLRAVPPPPRSSLPPRPSIPPPPPAAPLAARPPSPPAATLPPATLPPSYAPYDEEEGDTLVEGLEQDSFDATLMGVLAPAASPTPIADRIGEGARMLESITEEVVERIDEALLSLAEQKLVRPLYAIGGAIAVRAMIVPVFLVFLLGVWIGTPAETLDKTYPKAPVVAAATPPPAAVLPEPVAAPPVAAAEAPPEAAPAAEPAPVATPAPTPNRRALALRRARARRRAAGRGRTSRRQGSPARRARRR